MPFDMRYKIDILWLKPQDDGNTKSQDDRET